MSTITPRYIWETNQGALSLFLKQEDPLFKLKTEDGETIDIPNDKVHSFPVVTQLDSFEELYMQYVPRVSRIANNSFSVHFQLMAVPIPGLDSSSETINKNFGSFSFNFNKLEEKQLVNFSKDAPFYRRVGQGLSLRGVCKKEGCKAYDEVVYINKGIGEFYIPQEINRSQCPACESKIPSKEITNLGFWSCRYTIEGKRHQGVEEFRQEETAESKHYTTFTPGVDCQWEYLIVKTEALSSKEKKNSSQPQSKTKQSSFCLIS